MSKTVFSSLKTAVKGSALLVGATVAGQALWFIIRVLIVRNVTQAEFGMYALALTIMSVATAISHLGLYEGATRFISVAKGRGDTEKLWGTIKSVLQVCLLSSGILTLVLLLSAEPLSVIVFDMPGLTNLLRVIAVSILAATMLDILMGILRGHGIMGPMAVNTVTYPLIYILMLLAVFLFELPLVAVVGAFAAANVVSFFGVSAYTYKSLGLGRILLKEVVTLRGELLRFSLPLFGVAFMVLIMTWTDTLMLGYFMKAEDVGLYNVGYSLSRLLVFPINIISFVFMPIAGELYARGKMDDLKRTYQVLTKWVFAATFPVFLVLFFFPEMTLIFLFGQEYEASAVVLRLLSLNFMFSLLAGSSSLVLTVLGRTSLLMWITVAGAISNVVLNYFLIPRLGISGAATATLMSNLLLLLLSSIILFRFSRIHPFTSRYIKPIITSGVITLVIYAVAKSLPLYFWMMPIYLLLFIGGYALSILLTKSIEKEDIFIFDAITGKLGIELEPVRRLLNRFAHE